MLDIIMIAVGLFSVISIFTLSVKILKILFGQNNQTFTARLKKAFSLVVYIVIFYGLVLLAVARLFR